MKSARHSWLCALLLTGCAGSGGERSVEAADPSELAYSRLAFVQAGTVTTSLELEGLVKTFDRRGDAWGAWLASQELCQFLYRTRSDDWLVACRDSLARAELTNRGSALFVANMQLYLYTGDPAYVAHARPAGLIPNTTTPG